MGIKVHGPGVPALPLTRELLLKVNPVDPLMERQRQINDRGTGGRHFESLTLQGGDDCRPHRLGREGSSHIGRPSFWV